MSQNETAEDRVLSGKAWEDFCDRLKAAGQVILSPKRWLLLSIARKDGAI